MIDTGGFLNFDAISKISDFAIFRPILNNVINTSRVSQYHIMCIAMAAGYVKSFYTMNIILPLSISG